MLTSIARFEIRYQVKNPVFWVAAAIFFLLCFGFTASENVSFGTPGAVHENAPSAIATANAVLSLFYLFVVMIRAVSRRSCAQLRSPTAKSY